MVTNMVVLNHPKMPSYEGAEPDLTGLEVMVTWSKGGVPVKQEIEKDISKFTVYPPIAYVNVGGTSEFFSPPGRYAIQYAGEDDIYSVVAAYRVNVYIPAVIALAKTTAVTTSPAPAGTVSSAYAPYVYGIEGKIKEAFEDLGVDARTVTFKGSYVNFNEGAEWGAGATDDWVASATKFAPELKLTAADFLAMWYKDPTDTTKNALWPKLKVIDPDAGFAVTGLKVSSSSEAWEINKRVDPNDVNKKSYTATYLAGLNNFETDKKKNVKDVEITSFYRVDRLDYDATGNEIANVKSIAADNDTFGGNNVKRGGDRNTNNSSPDADKRALLKIEGATEATMLAWVEELNTAKIKFNVIYYLDSDTDLEAIKYKTRGITMADYIKAMYTMGPYETTAGVVYAPRATLPIFTGFTDKERTYPQADYDASTNPYVTNPSSPQHWAYKDADYNLYLSLFYYSDLIDPATKIGKGALKSSIPLTDISYLNGNGASIPIATEDFSLVGQFASFDKKRKDKTDHPSVLGGEPVIYQTVVNADINAAAAAGGDEGQAPVNLVTGKGTPYPRSRKALYEQLQQYWTPIWKYTDPRGGPDIEIEVSKWYTFDGRVPTGATGWKTYQQVGLQDYDFDDIESEETRQCEVMFPAPPSLGPSEDDTLEFDYIVKPS